MALRVSQGTSYLGGWMRKKPIVRLPKRTPDHALSRLNPERLNFLTDGVYAIALTLLVLELKPPEIQTSDQLLHSLYAELPRIGVFVIAFSAGAIGWTFNYLVKTLVDRINGLHTFLTLGSLLVVSFIPFTSALMGRYPDMAWGIVAYCANVGALSGVYALDLIVNRNALVPPQVNGRLIIVFIVSGLSVTLATVICALIALANPHAALFIIAAATASIWIEYLILAPWVAREARHVHHQHAL